MGRGYTSARFRQIVSSIRARLPDAAVTADAIVGFPGETEAQFEATLQLMRDVRFDQINTAAYSPRPHTPAALWDNQVGVGRVEGGARGGHGEVRERGRTGALRLGRVAAGRAGCKDVGQAGGSG
jgi:hypothetical protein